MSYLGPKTSNLDPVINYISNGRAYNSTEGWSTYSNYPSTYPTSGSGGTPVATWTRNQNPLALRQGAEFLFNSNSAYAGDGVAYDFEIDQADRAKVLTITFDHVLRSGVYGTGDLTVYVIEDPNGDINGPRLIQPTGYKIQSATVETAMKHVATFQTGAAGSGSLYRLCFHIASENEGAFELAIDNVVVGPQVVQYGSMVTEWKTFTPTGTWTTNTSYTGKYRIVGDIMEMRVRALCSGAPTAANLTVNLPSGFSIDSSKLVETTAGVGSLGYGSALNAATSFHGLLVNYNNATSVNVYVGGTGSTYLTNANVSNTIPFTFGAADAVDIVASFPLLGFGATVQMSNDTDTRIVVTRRTGPSAVSFTADTLVTFTNSASPDTHGGWTSTSAYTVPVPGVYKISALFLTAGNTLSTTGAFQVFYRINNGASNRIGYVVGNGASNAWAAGGSDTISLNAGDIITFRVSSSSTATVNAGFATIERLSGPSAIAASETINAKYVTSAGPSITAAGNIITYGTKVFDSHGSMSGNSYIVPVAGIYSVSSMLFTASASWGALGYVYAEVLKNGVADSTLGFYRGATAVTTSFSSAGTTLVKCNAGDTLQIKIYSSVSTSLATSTVDNYVCFSKVGN